MSNFKAKPVSMALSAALLAIAIAPVANAEVNPFSATPMSAGYDVVNAGAHEGKCGGDAKKAGEGKCGEAKGAEGKCGEGKCGEGKKADDKGAEGKCGEGKCGEGKKAEAKGAEGKCGEGKCGEGKK